MRSVVLDLVQPSSAAAERIFSILKNILEVVGNTPLEDDVESRVFAQVNKRRFEWVIHPPCVISSSSIALAHRCSALGIFTRQYRYVVVVV